MWAKFVLLLFRALAPLPLPWLRALGAGLGALLYPLARKRRRIVERNLAACFPQLTPAQRRKELKAVFRHFGQSWLDRAWLWHGSEAVLQQRLRWQGPVELLQAEKPVLIFAPHFMGLDAGGTAITLLCQRPVASIYSAQRNPYLDAWVRQGRNRFGNAILAPRHDSIRGVINAIRRENAHFYLLPDMDLGAKDAEFVPFFGVTAATVSSLPRMARMGRVPVLAMYTVLDAQGYTVHVSPLWENYPSDDVVADTRRMNAELEAAIEQHGIAQYYWVHKRFKTRPQGEAPFYD